MGAVHLAAREHHLARHEDEQHYLGFDHPIDQPREELRLVLWGVEGGGRHAGR